jgi:diketogulonate reductase-like aldo/keto reductase
MDPTMPARELPGGVRMPLLGIGVYKVPPGPTTEQVVRCALDVGYRHIDTAALYENEESVGAALRASGVPREDVFVTTKLLPPRAPVMGRDAGSLLEASLRRLGLDHVDLYLMHHPFFAAADPSLLTSKWAEMEALRDSGRARSIGVSNFLREHLEPILAVARHPPVINQIEYHPYLQHDGGGEDLVRWCQGKGVAVAGYSVLTPLTSSRDGPVDGVYARLAKKMGWGRARWG